MGTDDNIGGRRPYTFDRVVRILFSVVSLIAVLYLLDVLKGVVAPRFLCGVPDSIHARASGSVEHALASPQEAVCSGGDYPA